MIEKNQYRKILKCLQKNFPTREGELSYYDDIIYSCPDAVGCGNLAKTVLYRCVEELKDRLLTEVTLNAAITPLAACYAERLQQMKVTLHETNGTDPMEDLSLLCFAMSYDLKWIAEKADEIELKEELAEREKPSSTESSYVSSKPPLPEIVYTDEEDDLPF